MLKTKRIAEPHEETDGRRILITRYWPRDTKREHFDEWQKELAPSISLLKGIKNGSISDEEFARRFEAEIQDNEVSRAAINELRRARSDATLLCHEPEGVSATAIYYGVLLRALTSLQPTMTSPDLPFCLPYLYPEFVLEPQINI